MIGTILERFEAKFVKSDGCWEWQANKNRRGYGAFRVNGKYEKAHRVSYRLYVGDIQAGMCVCHHCDNPSCVNPDHLFLGTHADNMHDCEIKGRGKGKGRGQRGEEHHSAKLTEDNVIKIREMLNDGLNPKDIALEFGVSKSIVYLISHRLRWAFI